VDRAANPAAAAAVGTDNVRASSEAVAPTAVVPTLEAPPYARFAAQVIGFGLCLSIAALNAAANVAHHYWRVWPVAAISSLVAVVLMLRIPGAWRRIETGRDDTGYPRKLLTRSFVFVVLFVATAALVGAAIGHSGGDTAHLVADFKEMSRLGARISQARNDAEQTVPANIEMYKAIEADVQNFDEVLHRLQAELPVYDDKFPDQHEETTKSMQSIKIGIKRASLIKQQIGVARDIEGLSPDPRWQAWKERMQPLLDAETALDND
jgi:hypothetical protein